VADLALARVVHLVSVLLWIGGVAFVTMVIMPSIRRDYRDNERLGAFSRIESGFAPQARVWVLFAGASGFWMIWRADMWNRFPEPAFWWMSAMVAVWAVFALMLFVLEPLVIHRRMRISADPAADFARMVRMHRILLAASLITFAGAVGGSHGLW